MLATVSSANAILVQFRLYVLFSVLQLQFYHLLPLFPSFLFDFQQYLFSTCSKFHFC